MDSTRQNRVSNSLLIALSAHLVFAMLLALTLTTDVKEKDYIELDWVKLPRTARAIKKPKIKRVEPTIRTPKSLNLAQHRVNPSAKPLEVKAAASRSFSLIRDSADLSVGTPEARMEDVKTEAKIPVKPHEITLSSRQGEGGESKRGVVTGGVGTASGRGKGKAGKGIRGGGGVDQLPILLV